MQQVITIGPNGSLTGLQHKPGQGVDLRQFGRADIQRASEVLHCADRQKWYVEFRHAGTFTGKRLTHSMLFDAGHDLSNGQPVQDTTAYFQDYDEAVAGEIAVLNYLRLQDSRALDKPANAATAAA